jgi:hypothetical protein
MPELHGIKYRFWDRGNAAIDVYAESRFSRLLESERLGENNAD